MLKIVFFSLALFMVQGCGKEPLQFFPQNHMDIFATEVDREGVKRPSKGESVVVVSPPETTDELLKAIKEYNKNTVSQKILQKYPYYYSRAFFKESSHTQRKFKKSDDFINMDGEPNMPFEDIIVRVVWKDFKVIEYIFYGDYAKKYCPHHIIYEDDGSVRERCRKEK